MQKNPDTKLQQALSGQYEIDIKAALKEGWEMTRNSRGAMLQGVVMVIVISVCLMLAIELVTQQRGLNKEDYDVQLMTNLLLTILVAPFAAALVMMGVDNSRGKLIRFSDVFKYVSRIFVLTFTALITTAFVQIGLLLFILPGFYMVIATGFAVPLVLDKQMLPMHAVLTSIKVVNHKWQEFVKLYALFFVLLMAVVLTFGIALIWVAPFYYNVKGVLYRDIFSEQKADTEPNSEQEETSELSSNGSDDLFNA